MNYLLSAIHLAAFEGNIQELARVLRKGDESPDGFCFDSSTNLRVTPLHVAADGEAVRVLLAAGARLEDGERGWTPLHQAAREGRLEAARALLDAGANPRSVHEDTGEQPVHQAAQGGHGALVRLLLEHGASPEQTARSGTRPLHHASSPEVLEVLLSAGADPTVRDALGFTALGLALQREDGPCIQRLNAARAPVGNTPPRVLPPRVQRGLVTLEPKGCDQLLPAIVIGHDVAAWPNLRELRAGLTGSLPHASWLLSVDHQAGGYRMSYPEVLGLMMRLESNATRALKSPSRLLRGFVAMSEDPDCALLEREYPLLRPCAGTQGDPYPPELLSLLHQEVSSVFALPGFDQGREAFVRLEPCDLMRVFGGWRVMGLRTPSDEDRIPDCLRYDSLSELVRDEDVPLTSELLRDLQVHCERFAGERLPPPRAWLLWENSD